MVLLCHGNCWLSDCCDCSPFVNALWETVIHEGFCQISVGCSFGMRICFDTKRNPGCKESCTEILSSYALGNKALYVLCFSASLILFSTSTEVVLMRMSLSPADSSILSFLWSLIFWTSSSCCFPSTSIISLMDLSSRL